MGERFYVESGTALELLDHDGRRFTFQSPGAEYPLMDIEFKDRGAKQTISVHGPHRKDPDWTAPVRPPQGISLEVSMPTIPETARQSVAESIASLVFSIKELSLSETNNGREEV